jgi:hypothetical protein
MHYQGLAMPLLRISVYAVTITACLSACIQDGSEITPDSVNGDLGPLIPFSDPPPPPPPPPCSGAACNGLDPEATGCAASANAYLSFPYCYIMNLGISAALVEMRYSYGCGTKWTRTTLNVDYAISMRAIIKRFDGQASITYEYTEQPPRNQIWSAMVYDPLGGSDSSISRGKIRTDADHGNKELICITASSD